MRDLEQKKTKGTKMDKQLKSLLAAHKTEALAKTVWETAKELELHYADVIECCATLVRTTATHSGVSVSELMLELKRRL